jgi:hypothetical protein
MLTGPTQLSKNTTHITPQNVRVICSPNGLDYRGFEKTQKRFFWWGGNRKDAIHGVSSQQPLFYLWPILFDFSGTY